MPSPREFHRTVIKIEILSEEPFAPESLEEIDYAIRNGDVYGKVAEPISQVISAKTCALALVDIEEDPEVFRLTEDGEDLEDLEDEEEDDEDAEDAEPLPPQFHFSF